MTLNKSNFQTDLGVNSGQFISHYTSLNTAIEFILKDKQLRFSSINLTNDPREYKRKLIGAMSYGHEADYEGEKRVETYFDDRIQNNCKVSCFSSDTEENPHNLLTKKSFCRPAMWAHYAKNHEGVCLVFNKELLTLEFKYQSSKLRYFSHNEIVYDDYLNTNDARYTTLENLKHNNEELEAYFTNELSKNQLKWFFRKDEGWSNENEYRFLLYSGKKGYDYLSYTNSLQYIILGEQCSESYVCSLLSLCPNTLILKLNWNVSEQDYYLTEIVSKS